MSAEKGYYLTTRKLLEARRQIILKSAELRIAGSKNSQEDVAHVQAANIVNGMAKAKRQTRPLADDLPKIW